MKHRRILSVLLTITMVMAMVMLTGTLATALAETTVTVSDWSGMQKAINNAKKDTIIQLSKDITCTKNGGDRIKVDGKTITIDLNGHKLDRNRTKSDGDGHVIEIKGDAYVTLKDSKGGGVITGGYATRGGGINIGSGAWLVFQGGTVTGNQAEWGGGIYVHGTLAMQGGVIKKNTASDLGGGICISSSGKVNNCNAGTVTENTADNGGGVFNNGSKNVSLRRLKITDNTSTDDGGAIENADSGKMSLFACTLTGNKTSDEGGGVFNGSGCTLSLDSCEISKNTAGDEGGGIFNKGPLTVVGSSKINDNTATKGHGGGIRMWSNEATLTGTEVSGNEAKNGQGGGIYIGGATLTVDGGTYSGNTARDDGGAIWTEGTLTVKGNATFEDNYSFNSGGAIRVKGKTTTIEGGTFKNNEASDSGGAIYVNDSTLKLYGGEITENTAWQYGGGVLVGKDGTLKVHGAPVVKNNTARTQGDDIFLRGSKKVELDAALTKGALLTADAEKVFDTIHGGADVRNKVNDAKADEIDYKFTKDFNKFNKDEDVAKYFATHERYTLLKSGNEAAVRPSNWSKLQALVNAAKSGDTIVLDCDYLAVKQDGALNIDSKKTLTIDLNGHTLDRGLTKPSARGAVIMNQGTLTIKDSAGGGTITGGYADQHAGGIWNPGTLTIEGGTITGNRCVNNGGGLYNKGTLTITGGAISGNIADENGGGLFSEGNLTISGGEITKNTAALSGGAMNIGGNIATITGGAFTGNTAAKYHGGGIYLSGATLNLYGGEITGNKAAMEGGGLLYGANSTLNVQGAPVVNDNSAPGSANILIRRGQVIGVTGLLTDGAKLDVLAQDITQVLTSGLESSGNSDAAAFTYKGDVPSTMDGEVYVNLEVKADVWVSDWDGLQKAVNNAKDGQIIGLSKSLSGKGKGRIKVDNGKKFTIELNGYSLNRARTSSDGDGHVIEVKGKSTLTITDVVGTGTIKGGWATRGGGINVAEGSTCILKGGTVTENKATYGGGVYAHGTFKMEGGFISNNSASNTGGGIQVNGSDKGKLELTGGTISGNTAGTFGGGVFNDKSKSVKLENVSIVGNYACGGGGLYNDDGSATLINCVVRGNVGSGSVNILNGSVAYVPSINETMTAMQNDGEVDWSIAGGIYNGEDASLTLENTVIEGNTTFGKGGGVFNNGKTVMTGGAIRNNTANAEGGGIRVWHGTVTINSGEITGNTTSKQGGGVYVGGATLNLYGGSITGNKASNEGSGVYFEENKNARVNVHGAPVVADNEDDCNLYLTDGRVLTLDGAMTKGAKLSVSLHGLEYGGNDWWDGEDITGHDGVITKNFKKYNGNDDPDDYFTTDVEAFTVKQRNDEVLVIESDWYDLQRQIDAAADGATITLDRDWFGCDKDDALNIPKDKTLTLDLNGHTLNRGLYNPTAGGAVIMNYGRLTIKDSKGTGLITGGWANEHAGGICNIGTLTLEGGTITGNKCAKNGGGIYNVGTLTVTGGAISKNNASTNGGGVYSEGALEISGGSFTGNTAGLSGGAINIAGNTATITGGKFTGNKATRYHGGGIYLSGATLNLFGGEITGNKAAMEGGGLLYGGDGTLNVQGEPVVKDNSAPTGANILIRSSRVINVTGGLTEGAKLDVTAQKTDDVLTQGLEASGSSLERFTYANGTVKVSDKDGELYVNFDVQADRWADSWKGLQDAVNKAKSGQVIALSKNIYADGADRIKVEGGKKITLDLNGYAMNRQRTKKGSDGHVIEVKGNSTLTITDSRGTGVIKGGWATRGGGINIEKGSTCILKGGTVTDNKAEYGGGVYAHGTFKMAGGMISNNDASDSGGGIHCGSEGKLELTGGSITDNTSNDCGGIYNSGSKNVTLENVTIANNTSNKGGGGFNNNKGGKVTLTDCVIRGNTASTGGGLWNQDNAELTLTNCTVTGNQADELGGGVYNKGTLTLSGGSFTGNTAGNGGGGLALATESKAANISGSLVVNGNTAPRGNNAFLSSGKAFTVSGAMADGAKVGVFLDTDTGIFAEGFGNTNPDENPAKYFFSENGWDLAVVFGDAALIDAGRLEDNSGSFIHGDSKIVSYENLNSRNWMSGISGERRLNEINIPGTHDAAMARPYSVRSLWEDGGSFFNGYKDAQTQIRYIDEQMNDGFRYFDLRLNNKYQKRHTIIEEICDIDYQDDGKNLWLCHGCDKKGGTYYALNHEGNRTSLDEVLEWTKSFLRKNPSEVIILSLRPETQWDDQWDTIWLRAKKIFYNFSRETNPSTGKPYLYMEDGVFGKNYSDYPKLKDCRGQVILRVNHDRDPNGTATLGGLASFGMGGKKYVRPDGGFEETPEIIIQHVNSFYNRYGGVKLPTDALTHLDLLYYVPTNIVEKTYYPLVHNVPAKTPIESASKVNPVLFADGGTFDKVGYYLGWVCMIDRATSYEAARIWRTNFYPMDYVTVTVKSGLSEADLASGQYTEMEGQTDELSAQDETSAAQASGQLPEEGEGTETEAEEGTQTYLLLKGTEITIPQCIYEYDPAETGRDFQSWNATGETENRTVMPGETFIVMEDTTFTGQWLAEGETSVDISWQDMDDMDGLRVDSLDLEVWPDEDPEHVYTQTVTAAEGWRAVLAGDVQKIVPIWERIDGEQGADTPEGYRYEVVDAASIAQTDEDAEVALMGSGLVVRMIHTPGGTVDASGAIEWDDDDNRDGVRPESVTLRLFKGEEELDSQTLTAENEWQYDFGELPYYEDGKKVEYRLVEDEIENYSAFAEEMRVTNTHTPKLTTVNGVIFWDDAANENGQRPESVTVRLMANGEELSKLTVTADGASTTVLEFPYEEEETTPDGKTDENGEGVEEVYSETETIEAEELGDAGWSSSFDGVPDYAEGEVLEAEDLGEAGWSFHFYGVPAYADGEVLEYAIAEDQVEKYDYTIENGNVIYVTNFPLPATVSVSFDANGGTGEMEGAEIEPQSEYALPECGFTAPEGMMFAGWTIVVEAPQVEEPAAEGDTEAAEPAVETEAEPEAPTIYSVGDAISVTGNATVIAQWQPIPPVYTVTFDANGGEGEMEAAEPNEAGEYELPESAFTAPEGMEFAGWKVAVEGQPANEAAIESDEEAEWIDAIDPERVYEPGDTITLTGNATAIAQWQEPAKPIAITFDANGGEGEMTAAQPDEFGMYELPENGFTAPEGTEFAGWQIAAEAPETDEAEEDEAEAETEHVLSAGDVIVVSADTTVIAQWQMVEVPEETEPGEEISVTVTLKVVNGTWTDGTTEDKIIVLTGREGDELRLNLDDIPGVGYTPDEGYDMGSWDVEPSINVDMEGLEPDAPITEDTTYTYTYAVKEDVEVPTWQILFDANGGEGEMENANVEDMDGYKLPECEYTAPEGMEFAGWLVGEDVLDPGEVLVVTADTPVTAQWKALEEQPAEGPEGQPTEEQPTEEQPTEEQPTEEQPTEEQPTEEQPTEEQPTEEEPQEPSPVGEGGAEAPEEVPEEQPTEAGTEEQPEEQIEGGSEEQPVEGGTEEQPTDDQPAEGLEVEPGEEPAEEQPTEAGTEEQPMEAGTEEQPMEAGTEEQPTEEQPTAEEPQEPSPVGEGGAEAPEEVSEEQPSEDAQSTEEQPTEAGTEGQPTDEQPPEVQSVGAPADAEMRTITFDGGGADGEMASVQVAQGSEYTLPACEYSIEGCVFSAWTVSVEGAEPATYQAGETITVTDDMTVAAEWAFDESGAAAEPGEGEIEYGNGEGENADETAGDGESGLEVETENVPEEAPVEEGLATDEPSEVGSVFSGAGIAAIIAAAALVLGGAGIAIAKKKRK